MRITRRTTLKSVLALMAPAASGKRQKKEPFVDFGGWSSGVDGWMIEWIVQDNPTGSKSPIGYSFWRARKSKSNKSSGKSWITSPAAPIGKLYCQLTGRWKTDSFIMLESWARQEGCIDLADSCRDILKASML